MITDQLLKVSSTQVVTATAVSTDTIDLTQARDIGEGQELFMHFNCEEAAASAGATTVEFQVIVSAAAGLTSPTVVGSSGAIPKASLVVGTRIAVRINPQIGGLGLRYLGANYIVNTANLTTGKFSAQVVMDVQGANKNYGSGFAVL